MSDNKKFRIQNGVDVTGELSINDVVVIDANGKVVPEAISEAVAGFTSSDIAALQAQVSAILGTSPEALDTLQEIVASFQDADSNIVTTVSTNTTAIADMQSQVSTNTSAIEAANSRTSGISTSSGSSNIQMSAEVDMDGNKVTNMGEPTDSSDAATKDYVDVKSQVAITTGATDKAELLAAIAAGDASSVSTAALDATSKSETAKTQAISSAAADATAKVGVETTRATAAESGLQQEIDDIKSGTSEFTGDLIPDQDNVHSLGAPNKMWKDVYVGPGSLYINGQKVIEDNSGTITVNADPGQNLSLNTSGGGAIDLNSGDESVQIRSDLVISSTKTISTSGGAATKFGGDVDLQGNTVGNIADPVDSADAASKGYVDNIMAVPHTGTKTFSNDVVVQGNLTVSGSTVTVNSETMSIADNMVDLNSNMTSGTPTENAGIRIMRGDQSPKTFLWNEATDQWTAEGPLKADSFVGDGSGLSGMYGEADVTALVDSAYVQSRQSSSVAHATQADNADTLDGQHGSYYQPAATAITTGNIGAQSVSYATTSGNADTLDGINSTQFARTDLGNTWEPTNINTFKSTGASSLASQSSLQVYNDTTGEDAFMTFHVSNDFAVNFGLDASTNDLFVGGWSMTGPYKIWHEGNAPGVADLTSKLSPISTGVGVTGGLTTTGAVLVGKTVADNGTTGITLFPEGVGSFVADGSRAATFVRKTSDGDLMEFRRDSVTMGSIGVNAGSFAIGQSNTALGFFNTDRILFPATATGAVQNGQIDLGYVNGKFKDLYLSGDAYIGGNTAIHSGNIGSQIVSTSGVSYRLGNTATIEYSRPGLTWFDLNNPGSTGFEGTTSYNPVAEGGQDSWYHHIMMTHDNSTGYYTELVAGFHTNELWMHRLQGGVDKGWVEFVHSGNIGTQTVSHAATATSANQIDGLDFFNTSQTNVTTTPEGNGIGYYQSGTNFTGNATDGAIYSQHYSSNWQHKIFGDYRSGMIAVQGKNSGSLQAVKAVPTITVDTAPSFGWNSPGEMWWDTTSGRLKIAVGTETPDIQWVDASPSGNVETKFDKAGGTLTGPVTMMSQLDVRGTILAVDINASGTVTQASDASLKDDVQVIENAVEKVSQIRGVTFTRNDVEDDSRHAGVIAQEVESVLPEVVSETNGKKSVAYGNMVGLLIEAVKEQQATIDALAKRVEELEGE